MCSTRRSGKAKKMTQNNREQRNNTGTDKGRSDFEDDAGNKHNMKQQKYIKRGRDKGRSYVRESKGFANAADLVVHNVQDEQGGEDHAGQRRHR